MRSKLLVSMGLVVCLVMAFALPMCAPTPPAEEEEAPPIVPGKVYEWKFFAFYGPGASACCREWPILFDKVEKATNGQLKITIYWAGEHPFEGADALKVIKERNAELAHLYSGYVTAACPALGIDSVPMLLPADSDKAFEVLKGLYGGFEGDRSGVLERILQDDWDTTMVWLLPATFQRIHTKGYEVPDIGSLKGHKVRVYNPEFAKLIEILGGTPVSISSSETYTALATGLVDGVCTSLVYAQEAGWLEICDTTDLWEICAASDAMIANRDALAELPPDVRKAFLDVMEESMPSMREIEENDTLLEELVKQGHHVCTPSQEARDAVIKRAEEEIWPDWLEAGGSDAEEALAQAKEIMASL